MTIQSNAAVGAPIGGVVALNKRHSGFLVQSTFRAAGQHGNFETVVPLAAGGLAHFYRVNDAADLPWYGPLVFGQEMVDGLSMIQSDFGTPGLGNLEVVARIGNRLVHFWREDYAPFQWYGPYTIATGVAGNPALIQSNFRSATQHGNFEVVVPLESGGIGHFQRVDGPGVSWRGPITTFGIGKVDAVALIQSDFGTPGLGNLEVVARMGDRLAHFWRQDQAPFHWFGPTFFASGVAGNPALIQSTFSAAGRHGNFELVVPLAAGGLAHYYRVNDNSATPWYGPAKFGTDAVQAVSLIQSDFGTPGLGSLEVVAQIGERLGHFWRQDQAPFKWSGPTFFASTVLKERHLGFLMQHQEQSNWCWAATSVSVDHYYDPSSTSRQCQVVNAELGQTTCCQNGSTSQCNQPWYLDKALARVGRFDRWASGSVALQVLEGEVEAGRPLGVRIGWQGGGGHFVILDGYREGTLNWVKVEDPIYGESEVTYDAFRTVYQGSGSWTHSYYTKA